MQMSQEGSWAQQCSKRKLEKSFLAAEVINIDSDDDDNSIRDVSKQLVLFNPDLERQTQESTPTVSEITEEHASFRSFLSQDYSNPVLPSIGAFTIQCATCFKWRFVPTKEKYEELRENIMQELFVCKRACEWNRVLSCEDPEDIVQDDTHLWAIDKPSIAQTPPGWYRDVRLRSEGSTKFADVYYTTPSGRKLRSIVEIATYLAENPDYIRQGVNLTQFSFQIPRPLQENYVRKRNAFVSNRTVESFELAEVNPLSWANPPTRKELLGERGSSTPVYEFPTATNLGFSTPYPKAPTAMNVGSSTSILQNSNTRSLEQFKQFSYPRKKRTAVRRPPEKKWTTTPVFDLSKVKSEDAHPSTSAVYPEVL